MKNAGEREKNTQQMQNSVKFNSKERQEGLPIYEQCKINRGRTPEDEKLRESLKKIGSIKGLLIQRWIR